MKIIRNNNNGSVYESYISLNMSEMTNLTIEELNERIENKYEEFYSILMSHNTPRVDFFDTAWHLEILKLILNKKEYDKMNKQGKGKILDSYRMEFKSFVDTWNKENPGSKVVPSISWMFKTIKDEIDIAYFIIKWGTDGAIAWMQVMTAEERQAVYMLALIEHDCEIY